MESLVWMGRLGTCLGCVKCEMPGRQLDRQTWNLGSGSGCTYEFEDKTGR